MMPLLLTALAITQTEPPVRPAEVEIVRDAITDRIRAYAIMRDSGNRLVVSCDPARYEGARISFHSRRWLAQGNAVTGERGVTYRFDRLAPRRMMWDVENRRGMLAGERRVGWFLHELYGAERLVIRARDIENRRFDIVFRLRDARPAVEQALAACSQQTGA